MGDFNMQVRSELGMETDRWTHKSCIANVGTGDTWATIFYIESYEQRKGHATALINHMKDYYEKQNKVFGTSVAISNSMKHLVAKLKLKEYE